MGCGDSDDDSVDKCDLEAADSCSGDLVCTEQADGSGKCQLQPGAGCDPEAEDPNCQIGSECKDRPADATDLPEHVCLVSKSSKCDPIEPFCDADLTCAELQDGSYECHAPLLVRGTVRDATDSAEIAGAHIIGLDAQRVAVTDVAVSEADGTYVLEFPVTRDADGVPIATSFTLRASAQGYQTFPGGLRTAIPISSEDAEETEEGYVVETSITELSLIELPDDGVERYQLSGHLSDVAGSTTAETLAQLSGVLIVAEGAETWTSITDKRGAFTIFNLPDGEFELDGYAAGVDVVGMPFEIDGLDETDLELEAKLGTLAKVSGNVQIVNPGDGSATSVILVVESTFNESSGRGDSPRGLRAPRTGTPSIAGSFSIVDVPPGRYVVLAAFENDALVRDPDTNIAGTELVRITVEASDIAVPDSFKVTGALMIVGPGATEPEAVSSAPMLEWQDDSSEDWYEVRVYDAFGEEVWSDLQVPGASGSDVSIAYGGPLDVGMYYQFRVLSWREAGGGKPAAPISATEDLLGVFYVTP